MDLFQFSLRDQASNWLECLLAGSITIWEDLTIHFLARFFPPGRTAKLRNDILIKLRDKNSNESWEIIENLASRTTRAGSKEKKMNNNIDMTADGGINQIDTKMSVKKAEMDNEAENRTKNEPVKKVENKRTVEALTLSP
ncbi:zinc finger, CCHC-type containing protein [Tanacetum coccineum]